MAFAAQEMCCVSGNLQTPTCTWHRTLSQQSSAFERGGQVGSVCGKEDDEGCGFSVPGA